MVKRLRIGTRGSQLALCQANMVKALLQDAHPGLEVELVVIKTTGDLILDRPLYAVGGKGLFVKEIEQALIDEKVDLAVHSMKDVPQALPEGLAVTTILPREDVRDVLVMKPGNTRAVLEKGGTIATGSLRRQLQVKAVFPACEIIPVRGNVDTRLKKALDEQCSAVVLAAAGLNRLGLAGHISLHLSLDESLPAGGQGAVGIEIRSRDKATQQALEPLNDINTFTAVTAERSFLAAVGGDCRTPIAVHAVVKGETLELRYRLPAFGDIPCSEGKLVGKAQQAALLGTTLAETAIAAGIRTAVDKLMQSLGI